MVTGYILDNLTKLQHFSKNLLGLLSFPKGLLSPVRLRSFPLEWNQCFLTTFLCIIAKSVVKHSSRYWFHSFNCNARKTKYFMGQLIAYCYNINGNFECLLKIFIFLGNFPFSEKKSLQSHYLTQLWICASETHWLSLMYTMFFLARINMQIIILFCRKDLYVPLMALKILRMSWTAIRLKNWISQSILQTCPSRSTGMLIFPSTLWSQKSACTASFLIFQQCHFLTFLLWGVSKR